MIDFSGNYAMKYDSEIQRVHFGAARSQISPHSGVLYFSANKEHANGESSEKFDITSATFCSVSDSLYHDPAAIWDHLVPLQELIRERHPSVDTVHFQSDGPKCAIPQHEKLVCLSSLVSNLDGKIQPGISQRPGMGKALRMALETVAMLRW